MIDVRKKLQDELNAIERELRVDLPREILKAREHGDLSENSEYKAAKERQSYVEGRKAQLQQRLAAMLLVNFDKIPTDRAAYGSKVVLYEYETDKEVEYQLVTAEESNISKGLISITSPIGRGIVGKMVGDSVEIVTPSGRKDCELRSLRTIHDIEE
jgi:transcription elongation factor GreA